MAEFGGRLEERCSAGSRGDPLGCEEEVAQGRAGLDGRFCDYVPAV